MTPCPCGSQKPFNACCGPLIAGAPAATAEALMRSRYSAYSLGNLDYIEKTNTDEAALAFGRARDHAAEPSMQWLDLTIHSTEGGGALDSQGAVTFSARYRQNGRIFNLAERSQFRRVSGEWRYAKGEVSLDSKSAPAAQIGRNDPCPCESGKKYKKCCGV